MFILNISLPELKILCTDEELVDESLIEKAKLIGGDHSFTLPLTTCGLSVQLTVCFKLSPLCGIRNGGNW